jgi:SAM-dependent methyltransferase
MYIYATEMVSAYYNCLNLRRKRVLSITGSGDQIINAYLRGAKEVIGFDINQYASSILELKISALINLNYFEFLNFFGNSMDNGTLDFKLYSKVKKDLSNKTHKFFLALYKEFDYNGKRLIKSDYFRERSSIKVAPIKINTYLKDEESYLYCRDIIKGKKFQSLTLDINDIAVSNSLRGKFDIINLSNVLNYLTGNTKSEDIIKTLTSVMRNVSKRLKPHGLFFYYSYSPHGFQGYKIPPASQLEVIDEIKKVGYFEVVFKKFSGVSFKTFDRVNLFKKSENKSGNPTPKIK